MGDSFPLSLLRNSGLKITKNREQVLSVLHSSSRPLNHQEIMERLPKEESWDRVTIYRALADLEEKQILNSLHSPDRITYFELKEKETPKHVHGHLICSQCGKIECVDDPWRGKPSAKSLKGFQVDMVEIVFRGACQACQAH